MPNRRLISHSSPLGRNRRSAQCGLGLLEVMLLTILIAGSLVAGFVALRSRLPSDAADDVMRSVAQADRSITGFVSAHHRMPCPDSSGTGLEDCTAGVQKGKLPYRTLGLDGASIGTGFTQMGYLVQRHAVDLAASSDPTSPGVNKRYEPIAFDTSNKTGPNFYSAHRSLNALGTSADFCQSLADARAMTVQPGDAQTTSGFAVAYALMHPGARDADGDGNLLDGRNEGNGGTVEAPDRTDDRSNYDDRVNVRTYDELAQALDCPRFNTSLDTVSMATEVTEEVNSQKTSTLLSASVLTGLAGVKAIVGGIKIAGSAATIATGSGYLATASSLLAAAIASCVVLVGCAEIPHAAASVAAASVAIAAASVAIGLNVAAIAANVVAFGITLAAAIQAGAVQTADIDISAAVASSKVTWNTRITETAAAKGRLDTANANLASLAIQNDGTWQTVLDTAHQIITDTNNAGSPTKGTMSTTALDSYLTAARDRANDWVSAQLNLDKAREVLKQATDTANAGAGNANAQTLANLQSQLAAAQAAGDTARAAQIQQAIDAINVAPASGDNTAQAAQLSAQISVLNTQISTTNDQIAAEADPDRRAVLVKQRDGLTTQRDALQAQLAALPISVATAQANVNIAQQAVNDAYTSYSNARTNAVNAFNAPNLQYTRCVPVKDKPDQCTTYGYDGRSRIQIKLNAYFDTPICNIVGLCDSWIPNTGVFFKWRASSGKQQLAQSDYNQAVTQEASAKSAYDSLAGLAIGSGTGGDGSDINPVFTGAETILKQLELRGAVQ